MATNSSILAWKISWRQEHARLQSMGSQTIGHDLVTEHTSVNNVRMRMLLILVIDGAWFLLAL